jgi:hypothetical protein
LARKKHLRSSRRQEMKLTQKLFLQHGGRIFISHKYGLYAQSVFVPFWVKKPNEDIIPYLDALTSMSEVRAVYETVDDYLDENKRKRRYSWG